jgi:hypothetical protein
MSKSFSVCTEGRRFPLLRAAALSDLLRKRSRAVDSVSSHAEDALDTPRRHRKPGYPLRRLDS